MEFSLDGSLEEVKEKAVKKPKAAAPEAKVTPAQQVMAEGAKSSVEGEQLPSGYMEEDGQVYSDVTFREMTGEEEDILTSKRMPMYTRFQKILENCVTAIGPYNNKSNKFPSVIKSLTAGDRMFCILHLRILSLGPIFSAKCVCTECEAKSMQHIDLHDFVFKPIKIKDKRSWTGKLPVSGMTYTAKVQTGWDEPKIQKYAESKDKLSIAMMARILDLDGKPVNLNQIKKLGFRDRQFLRKEFVDYEGEMDTSIEYECDECGAEVKHEVDIATPGFFFPSEA